MLKVSKVSRTGAGLSAWLRPRAPVARQLIKLFWGFENCNWSCEFFSGYLLIVEVTPGINWFLTGVSAKLQAEGASVGPDGGFRRQTARLLFFLLSTVL